MNISNLTTNIFNEKLFLEFDNLYKYSSFSKNNINDLTSSIHELDSYWKFISKILTDEEGYLQNIIIKNYISDINDCAEIFELFYDDLKLKQFILSNFSNIKIYEYIDLLANKKYTKKIERFIKVYQQCISTNFDELHKSFDNVLIILKSIKYPPALFKLYESSIFPNFFNIKNINNKDFISFWKTIVEYQELPFDIFLKYIDILKNKDIKNSLNNSLRYNYYFNKISLYPKLYKELKIFKTDFN